MFALGHDLQIVGVIVCFVSVNVVDHLAFLKFPSDLLFCDYPVLVSAVIFGISFCRFDPLFCEARLRYIFRLVQ